MKNVNLSVKIGKLSLKNPVMVASGTFGYAGEFQDFLDLSKLGAIVTKTITLNPRSGNMPPRTCETPSGMLNSIGLENPGLKYFLKDKLPALKETGVPLILSIAAEKDPEEFLRIIESVNKVDAVNALELNISCPNIKHPETKTQNARLISQDQEATYNIVKNIRSATGKTLITKLSPNVTDIVEIALAAQSAGSDAISLINTLLGMSIDVDKRIAKIKAVTGGLSGPAIRPIALRMTWEAYQKVKIPIVAMGGIMDTESALEFFIAGATAVSTGTANFINPHVSIEIIEGIKKYMLKYGMRNISNLTGSLKV